MSSATILMAFAVLPANFVSLGGLLILWAIAGFGQTLVNVTVQNLIADQVATELQGRVYGAHFAWRHLWWAFSYPLTGWLGQYLPQSNFAVSSLVGLVLLILICLTLRPQLLTSLQHGQ